MYKSLHFEYHSSTTLQHHFSKHISFFDTTITQWLKRRKKGTSRFCCFPLHLIRVYILFLSVLYFSYFTMKSFFLWFRSHVYCSCKDAFHFQLFYCCYQSVFSYIFYQFQEEEKRKNNERNLYDDEKRTERFGVIFT